MVNSAVCDKLCIRYGVIVGGPFEVPEGYHLSSMAVYVYFEGDHAVKPVLLHLPHWAGKDGESSLKCANAPHRLEEGEEKYKFRLTEYGDFRSTNVSGVIGVDSHCSLFVIVFGKRASSNFFAISIEKEDVSGSTLDLVITYAHDVWCEVGVSIHMHGLMYYHNVPPSVVSCLKKIPLHYMYSIVSSVILI